MKVLIPQYLAGNFSVETPDGTTLFLISDDSCIDLGLAECVFPCPPRHGRTLSPDEPLSPGPLRRFTAAAGWALTAYDDAPDRFFAVAERR